MKDRGPKLCEMTAAISSNPSCHASDATALPSSGEGQADVLVTTASKRHDALKLINGHFSP